MLRRVTAAFDPNGAYRIHGNAILQNARDRAGDVETVQTVEGLILSTAVQMNAPHTILHHARNQRQGVAKVVSSRKGEIDDLFRCESGLDGSFLAVDGGGGIDHAHRFLIFLLVIQNYFEGSRTIRNSQGARNESIEPPFLHLEIVRAGRDGKHKKVACFITDRVQRHVKLRSRKGYLGALYGQAVFVHYSSGKLRRRSRFASENERQKCGKQHFSKPRVKHEKDSNS